MESNQDETSDYRDEDLAVVNVLMIMWNEDAPITSGGRVWAPAKTLQLTKGERRAKGEESIIYLLRATTNEE